jgi:hypothetical protein
VTLFPVSTVLPFSILRVAPRRQEKKVVTPYFADFLAINQLTLIAVVGIGGGLFLFFRGFRLLARRRLLLNTPASKIRSAAMGLVEVSGLATGPYSFPAPITGQPCFLYRTTAWQQRNSSKNHEWEKVADETLHVPFFLDDGTGQLLVDPYGAELDLHRDFREEYNASFFSTVDMTPPRVNAFLARHGIAPGGRIRIEERLIKPENTLFVVGTLAENSGCTVRPLAFTGPSEGFFDRGNDVMDERMPEPVPEVVRLSESTAPSTSAEMTQQAKIAAALTKAGIQKPEAWAVAGIPRGGVSNAGMSNAGAPKEGAIVQSATLLAQVSITGTNQPGKAEDETHVNLGPPVVLRKGENNPVFLISWRSQHDVVRSLAWKSAAMVWGGGALTLLGLYVLLAQMEVL